VAVLKADLEKVEGIFDVAIDRKTKIANLKVRDEKKLDQVCRAVQNAGMHGFFDVNGTQKLEFAPVGEALGGDTPKPVKEIVLKDVHACCPECQKAFTDLVGNAKVKFDGDGPTKTVMISGENLDKNKIILALWRAGFNVK